jgi:UDP-glucose 4-epimerase
MTILVTGGAGYIGSHMVHALVDRGLPVVVVDDLSTGYDAVLPPQARLVVGDIGDEALLDRVIAEEGVRGIAHFAGSIVVPESVADPLGYYRNNTSNSRNLIAAAVRGGVKAFLFSSTAAVYGEPENPLIDETAPPSPVSPYGWSKLMTEIMLRDAARAHGFGYAVLRYFNVAGADPAARTGQSSPKATHLIKVASQAALGQRGHMEVYGTDFPTKDGTGVRDYIHVSDLIDAHVLALTHLLEGGDSLTANCGYGRGFSVLEVVDAVKRVSGVDFDVRMGPRRAGDPAALVADSTRIRNLLGWRPAHDDLDTIVSHAFAWERVLATRNSKPRDQSRES